MKSLLKLSLLLAGFLLVTAFLASISITSSNADIIFQDSESNSLASAVPFTEITDIVSPSGEVGDFQILGCTVPDEGQINMNPATPDWTTQDIGGCAGDPFCILGIFSNFSESTGGEFNTCSWGGGAVNAFGSGILRYSGVDPLVPVTALECDIGISDTAVAPSVETTANSVVVRIYAASVGIAEVMNLPDFGIGQVSTAAFSQLGGVSFYMVGQPFEEAGESGTLDLPLADVGFWRACSVALQMDTGRPVSRAIPTLSEWGLIAMAGVLGVIGLLAVRRKRAAE